ncbi:hypothetical protein [Carnobacterium alterfunditum]|uniref:hypothetical protein n=1 Tax=Carnobacterium alterfunditum TaxID=28230 RepID=UPI00359468FD
MNATLSVSEIERLSQLIDNVLFDNGYDIDSPYLVELITIKRKLDSEIVRN